MLEPAPVNAPAPTRTGAMRLVLLPMRAPSSMTVSYLLKPSQLHVMVPAPMLTSWPMRASPTYDKCGTLLSLPMRDFLISTNVPARARSSSTVPGRK